MKWRLTLLIIIMLTVTTPALAEGKMLTTPTMGFHSEYTSAGFAVIGVYVGEHPYNHNHQVLTLVVETRCEDGFTDTVGMVISTTNLETGITRISYFQQSNLQRERDSEFFGDNSHARVYVWGHYPCWKQGNTIPNHARVELHTYWGSGMWYWCEW